MVKADVEGTSSFIMPDNPLLKKRITICKKIINANTIKRTGPTSRIWFAELDTAFRMIRRTIH
jgi:hypothetical protein